MITRRNLLLSTASALAACTAAYGLGLFDASAAVEGSFEVTRTDAEWKRLLTPAQYDVLRREGTERAGSSPLDKEKRAGTFHCAACDLAVYASTTKFDSGTGWPSFWAPLDNAVATKTDRSFFMSRTEVHCRRCGGHLGHIFDDGPAPTGKRHCLNGIALKFVTA
ncbi:peptide-methionine (R)-S-oxide reductase MsrB [Bosea sp. PAMC 26642]|uniref:peptide-methionine (R)-S-oxide reductase MsrB n=1 Tax=Bosea sp. (strain PAMC 26642) TaxID=1792307 RepID=UPI00077039AA|nr:peptide-methionine (R)-S-oxide reductase MsrB [Bosea sp. PAMC 26642]AMJ61370.1 methionine sulfoxide reductase B [Bosea sp. PAMC 26642]